MALLVVWRWMTRADRRDAEKRARARLLRFCGTVASREIERVAR